MLGLSVGLHYRSGAAVIAAVVVMLSAQLLWAGGHTLFNRQVALDGFALYFKMLLSLAAFGTIWRLPSTQST